jgi:hypothetical protein
MREENKIKIGSPSYRWGKGDPLNSGALHKAMENNKTILYARANSESYYWMPESALQERLKEAKLQRTKEILEMLPVKKDEEEFDARWNAYADGFNTCLFQIKELLTKKDE